MIISSINKGAYVIERVVFPPSARGKKDGSTIWHLHDKVSGFTRPYRHEPTAEERASFVDFIIIVNSSH